MELARTSLYGALRLMNRTIKGTILTIIGASCWGMCAVAGKYITGVKMMDPAWMVDLRLVVAGTIMLLAASRSTLPNGHGIFDLLKNKESIKKIILIAIFSFAVCQVTYFTAIKLSNAGVATALQQTSPVFVMLYCLFIEKRMPRKYEILVLITVVYGSFLLATGGDYHTLVIPFAALALAIISSITCASYTLMPRPLIKEYGTMPTVGIGMILASILMMPFTNFFHGSGVWDMYTVLAFGYIVLFGTVAAFGCYLYGVTLIGPVRGSIFGLVEPLVAALMSGLILHQKFTITDYIGIAAIFAGVSFLAVVSARTSEE